MLANTAVIHVLITTVNIALLLVDNYNESCIIMAWSAESTHLLNGYSPILVSGSDLIKHCRALTR